MERGLPIFYDELVGILRADEESSTDVDDDRIGTTHRSSAVRRGKESLRLGYTVSQVVHGYGALCQAITEYSGKYAEQPVNDREFNRLNFCLDVAIADAVSEFSRGQQDTAATEEVQRLGFLAHEMRNALGNAAAAHQMIMKGMVGVGGSTSQILGDALRRMKDIIDRSLSEVRLRGEKTVELRRYRLVDILGEVESTGLLEALPKSIQLHIEVTPDLIIEVDRHLIVSALSNVVQNAIKFNVMNGNVWIRGKAVSDRVLIEIEDQCGGLPSGKIEELFRPFTQKGEDRSGLGLGLSIARRAVALNNGLISARDMPGKGCIFTVDLPKSHPILGEFDEVSTPVH